MRIFSKPLCKARPTECGTSPTSAGEKYRVLSVCFDLIDYECAFARIKEWRSAGLRKFVTITNPHSVMLCGRCREMAVATAGAGLTLPDGVGIILAANILGYPNHGRVAGPTLMLKLCEWGCQAGLRHYFYGGGEGIADKLAIAMKAKYPEIIIAGSYCPPFRQLTPQEDQEIVDKINSTKPDIVWVGLGAPKQEKWMAEHVGRIAAPAMIGVGAAFDFHTGNVKWAPACVRRLGLEWAWRLACEPKRMWRRNLDSPVFLLKALGQKLMLRCQKGDTTKP
jgi:N-acetylglucosaminyldiphosphoundecaprenol N-acetyl-beta-D-mannosaminyltransferase